MVNDFSSFAVLVASKMLINEPVKLQSISPTINKETDERMKKTYDMLVAMKLLDPRKVDLKKTYTTQFVKDLKVLP